MTKRALLLALALAASCTPPPPPPTSQTTTTVQITSVPTGLKVIFDGKELEGVTPLELRSVKAFDAHDVEVLMPGQESWKKRIAPPAGVKTVLRAEFGAAAPPPPGDLPPPAPADATDAGAAMAAPAPAPADATDAGAAAPAPPADATDAGSAAPAAAAAAPTDGGQDPLHATWPVKDVTIDGKVSALWVPEAGGVLVKNLNPKKSYRMWTEGFASLKKGVKTSTVRYFIDGEKVWQDEALGQLGVTPKTISGAKRLWLFDFDDDVSDNSGQLRVYIQESKLVPPTKMVWNPTRKEDVITPDPTKLFTLDGLNPGRTYTFAARQVLLHMRERPWGHLQTFLCRLDGPEGPARFELYQMKMVSQTFEGAKSITCFFLDASVEPNEGHMIMEFYNAP